MDWWVCIDRFVLIGLYWWFCMSHCYCLYHGFYARETEMVVLMSCLQFTVRLYNNLCTIFTGCVNIETFSLTLDLHLQTLHKPIYLELN